ncbi:hypothetical protein [Clostridium oceanicum]|uniref:HEPN domain-containing protein n=1 Tax=Clostridium oceanicum TaxID=1543 RepID=A0ABN1JL89_9CLOT
MSEKELLNGQAMSLQWATYLLSMAEKDININDGKVVKKLLCNAKTVTGSMSYEALEMGCLYASNFLLPFAIELALKSLLKKCQIKYSKKGQDGHNLEKLFEQLKQDKCKRDIQTKIQRKYENLSDGISGSIKDILFQHKLDFTQWRYLDNPKNLRVQTKKLQFVLCAILEIYDKLT